MGLIKCPDCGNMVSDRAAFCPSCGCPADAIRESLQEENKPDDSELTSLQILFRLLRLVDRQDLMLANDSVLKDLEQRLGADCPVTFIGKDNIEEQIAKIQNKEFAFPYVFVTANCRYTDHLKFTLTRDDGMSYQRYYDLKTRAANYTPVIEVFADSSKTADDITECITGLMKEPKTYSVPFVGGNDNLTFTIEDAQVSDLTALVDGADEKLFYRTITLSESPWAVSIDEEINSIQNSAMKTLRYLQLAQIDLMYALQKSDCDNQLELYEWLFNPAGKLTEVLGPFQSDEYKELRRRVHAGESIDSDLVDKAFNHISLFYHELPNDIYHKVTTADVKQNVYAVLAQYEASWTRICDSYELPEDINIPDYGWTSMSNNMRSVEGLGFLIEALYENPYRSVGDIIDECTQMVCEANEQSRIEADEREEEWQARREERRRARKGFTRDVIKIASGVAIGNKISGKKRKEDQ